MPRRFRFGSRSVRELVARRERAAASIWWVWIAAVGSGSLTRLKKLPLTGRDTLDMAFSNRNGPLSNKLAERLIRDWRTESEVE